MTDARFRERQQRHFERADPLHFRWQTAGAAIAERERGFVRGLIRDLRGPLLEIGSGEGANLFHLAPGARLAPVGCDAFLDKLRFAARAVPGARMVAADATRLPFRDGSFRSVLIRDVLHHLPEPRAALEEAARVLTPGGRLVLAEPNAGNPLIRLQMWLVPAERGAARSERAWLASLLEGLPLSAAELEVAAPLPLDRMVLHPRFGLPRLGRLAACRAALAGLERTAARLLPRDRWSYLVLRAERL